tara:strand:+ start:151 stop:693 length:543 start_codon:yes stop_codon:yes gene_type:complete
MTKLEEKKEMKFRHAGYDITVSGDGYFTRLSSELDYAGKPKIDKYDSLKKAKESIDTELAAARKAEQSQVNVTLLDEWGRTMTLRRVHEGTGDWLTRKGEHEKPRSGYLPMNVPRELLAQREALRAQVQEIDETLRPYSLRIPTGVGKQDPNRIESLVERLNDAVAQAQERVADLSKSEA